MGTGAKIAVGCGCVVLLGTAVVIGVLGAGAWWAKGKIDEVGAGVGAMTAQSEEAERYEKQANANAYAPNPDGVIAEDRLLKFLDVRRQVHGVYQRYESELRAIEKKAGSSSDKLTLPDLWTAGGSLARMAGDIRLAQMKALAADGMSEAEYRDIQVAVYKSAWASGAETESGQLPAEAVSEAMAEAASKAEEAVRTGAEAARREGVPGAEQISPQDARKLEEGLKELGEGAGRALHVPRANVELFRKYKADIQKYAMHGLAFIGL